MRTITDHKLNGLNDSLEITVLDEPGQGGACHKYEIIWHCSGELPNPGCDGRTLISFQNGPIKEEGVNGISNEALLAIVIDRLRCFQAGPYPSNENMHALPLAMQCLEWLQKRTRDRLARGVEGTNQQ
jgi:hypothetical protein